MACKVLLKCFVSILFSYYISLHFGYKYCNNANKNEKHFPTSKIVVFIVLKIFSFTNKKLKIQTLTVEK